MELVDTLFRLLRILQCSGLLDGSMDKRSEGSSRRLEKVVCLRAAEGLPQLRVRPSRVHFSPVHVFRAGMWMGGRWF